MKPDVDLLLGFSGGLLTGHKTVEEYRQRSKHSTSPGHFSNNCFFKCEGTDDVQRWYVTTKASNSIFHIYFRYFQVCNSMQ